MTVKVIGAGLAGSEAAWQLAKRGIRVKLYDIKPSGRTPAHKSGNFGELVCSNSLRSSELSTGPGLLKEELRRFGSLIMECADANRVEAGGALAVDREGFSQMITKKLTESPMIEVIEEEVTEIPEEGYVIIATGPLTTERMSDSIRKYFGGEEYLYFYDAAAPLVSFESIDMQKAFEASRYGKGTADYINCPMTKEEYDAFYKALISAEEAEVHGFEDKLVFEGCMPVEVMGRRGYDTLRYGPLKPVGLKDPRTGEEPYAVVQLRRDNRQGSLYNLVGFQTHLKFPEQKRVFSMIPGLENAEFLRYGVMHRNTYINSPKLLDFSYRVRNDKRIMFAGQMTGVEGYIESTSSGFVCGVNLAQTLREMEVIKFPVETAIGALAAYISDERLEKFQPMNINFGIMPPIRERVRGRRGKRLAFSNRALAAADEIKDTVIR